MVQSKNYYSIKSYILFIFWLFQRILLEISNTFSIIVRDFKQ